MGYTKENVIQLNCMQKAKDKNRFIDFISRIYKFILQHKFMTVIVSVTVIMMILDFVLISSFIDVLNNFRIV